MKIELTSAVLQGFVGSCLVKNFDGSFKTPQCHIDWWELCCSKEKYVAIAAPRRHAKSTAITISYTLASVLFRNRKFILLVSDTESQAVLFLGQIKQELQDNPDIVALFGLKTNNEGKVIFRKDTESDIIVEFDDGESFRIIAKGAEQKLRGLLWNSSRPDLIIIDDLENEELVMNKERREKLRRWFYGSLLPCTSQNGIIRYVGTILHMDAMLERLMPNPSSKHTKQDELRMWNDSRTSGWKSVKYKAHNNDFTEILWREAWPPERLRSERAAYIDQGLPDVYSQEFLNVPMDESNTYFKRADFLAIKPEDKEKKLNYYVAGDFAISEKERADWTVMMVGGVDEDGFIHIINVIRERMDGLTIVETMLSIQRLYDPIAFGVEDTQITKAVGPFLNREMIAQNTFINVVPLKPHKQDKITRARSIQARMRAGGVKFDKSADWYQTLEDECLRFPRDKHDDQVDSLAYLGLMVDKLIEAPTKEQIEDELYNDELNESGFNDAGRSAITGY